LYFCQSGAGRPVIAAATTEPPGHAATLATASMAKRDPPMTVTFVPRSDSGVFRDTALVYLDGRIDLHIGVDDHSRVAYVEILRDERRERRAFLRRALHWFRSHGVPFVGS
jgi:hypothetical protein